MTDRERLARIMQRQFHVWEDTENAYDILEDTCRVLGRDVLNIPISTTDSRELERFVDQCKGADFRRTRRD